MSYYQQVLIPIEIYENNGGYQIFLNYDDTDFNLRLLVLDVFKTRQEAEKYLDEYYERTKKNQSQYEIMIKKDD